MRTHIIGPVLTAISLLSGIAGCGPAERQAPAVSMNQQVDSLLPPPIQDTTAWIEQYRAPGAFISSEWSFVGCDLDEVSEPMEKVVFVHSDTLFDLSQIEEGMKGTLAFTWEPLTYDNRRDDSWNMQGIHAFTVETEDGQIYQQDLETILEIEPFSTISDDIVAKKVTFLDVNLDGFLDMKMAQAGGKTVYSCYFLYDPHAQNFALQFLDGISYPVLDCEKGLMYNYLGGSGSGTSFSTFELENGQFREVMYSHYYHKVGIDERGERFSWSSHEFIDVRNGGYNSLRADSTFQEYF